MGAPFGNNNASKGGSRNTGSASKRAISISRSGGTKKSSSSGKAYKKLSKIVNKKGVYQGPSSKNTSRSSATYKYRGITSRGGIRALKSK